MINKKSKSGKKIPDFDFHVFRQEFQPTTSRLCII